MENKLVGHEFLARLGKKRLRPGGKKGTNFLISAIKDYFKDTKNLNILVISCNRGYSLIEIYNKLKCNIVGIDISETAINFANDIIGKNNEYKQKIKVYKMNALEMDFNNKKFDVIINEAMLTMYKNKNDFLNEYIKHLKDDGILLTHDICLINKNYEDLVEWFKNVINLKPYPLSQQEWIQTFNQSNFKIYKNKIIKFSLVNPIGLINDEGLINMFKIMKNAIKKENINDFKNMRSFFKENKKYLKAICFVLLKNKG